MGRAALAGQRVMYALMLVVPTLAVLRAIGGGRGYAVFGWQVVDRSGVRIDWMAAPADLLHGRLAWVLLALVLGHAAMAVAHEVLWRDGVLLRMAGRAKGTAPG
jgi:cytochrome b561